MNSGLAVAVGDHTAVAVVVDDLAADVSDLEADMGNLKPSQSGRSLLDNMAMSQWSCSC